MSTFALDPRLGVYTEPPELLSGPLGVKFWPGCNNIVVVCCRGNDTTVVKVSDGGELLVTYRHDDCRLLNSVDVHPDGSCIAVGCSIDEDRDNPELVFVY